LQLRLKNFPRVSVSLALVYHSRFRIAKTMKTMAGLSKDTPRPSEIKLHRKSRVLEISFSDGRTFQFPCEFLRVYSPSAEVRGHNPEQEVLQTGKKDVGISHIEPVGNYAIQLNFSDGNNTGLYSWDLLYDYGLHQEEMWRRYLRRMEEAEASRDPVASTPGFSQHEGKK
jgi:DUF971 family protein